MKYKVPKSTTGANHDVIIDEINSNEVLIS